MDEARTAPRSAVAIALLAVAVLLQASLDGAAAQGIENGSFEAASVDPGGRYLGLSTGSVAIDYWTVVSGSVDYVGGYWPASDSSRSVDLNGRTAGAVEQSFETSPGTSYMLQFDLAGNPDSGPLVKVLQVTVADTSRSFTSDVTGVMRDSLSWQRETVPFTAINTTTTVRFASGNSGAYGPVIDNVRLAIATGSEATRPDAADVLVLKGIYPNPSHRRARISYASTRAGFVELTVFDTAGRRIEQLVERFHEAGDYVVVFETSHLAAGVYVCRLLGPRGSDASRLVVAE